MRDSGQYNFCLSEITFRLLRWNCTWKCRKKCIHSSTWWRQQMETFSALLALCAANSPVTGEFSAQWQVTRSFDAFFDLRLNERLSKQSWGWWFETLLRSLWRHSYEAGRVRHRSIIVHAMHVLLRFVMSLCFHSKSLVWLPCHVRSNSKLTWPSARYRFASRGVNLPQTLDTI